jgi:hypothetical protein
MSEVKKYGETETEKWAISLSKSRDIVKEIMDFGVSQDQIHQIINLLSLELENPEHMKAYVNVYKNVRDNKVEGSENTTKLILDS